MWSPALALNTTSGNTVVATPNTSTTYTVTGTDGNGCVNTDQVDVTVNTVPQINSFSNIVTCGQYILPSINGSVKSVDDTLGTLSNF